MRGGCPNMKKSGRQSRVDEGEWAHALEPTGDDALKADALISAFPAGPAIASIGDSVRVATFIGMRMVAFSIAYLVIGGALAPSISNPYFLVAVSSLFLALANLAVLLARRLGLPSYALRGSDIFETIAVFISAGVLTVAVIGPLLVFEVLLLAFTPQFFLLDLLLTVLSFLAWPKNQG